eukprot:2478876-Rhodomonas_salina.1
MVLLLVLSRECGWYQSECAAPFSQYACNVVRAHAALRRVLHPLPIGRLLSYAPSSTDIVRPTGLLVRSTEVGHASGTALQPGTEVGHARVPGEGGLRRGW